MNTVTPKLSAPSQIWVSLLNSHKETIDSKPQPTELESGIERAPNVNMRPTIAFLGEFGGERINWDQLANHVGWAIARVPDLESLSEFRKDALIVAVFTDWNSESCNNSVLLGQVHSIVPDARLVVCYRLGQPILAEELVALGAFHSVPRPLDVGEVRQSIGFIWEAWSRSRASRLLPRPVRKERCEHLLHPHRLIDIRDPADQVGKNGHRSTIDRGLALDASEAAFA